MCVWSMLCATKLAGIDKNVTFLKKSCADRLAKARILENRPLCEYSWWLVAEHNFRWGPKCTPLGLSGQQATTRNEGGGLLPIVQCIWQ